MPLVTARNMAWISDPGHSFYRAAVRWP